MGGFASNIFFTKTNEKKGNKTRNKISILILKTFYKNSLKKKWVINYDKTAAFTHFEEKYTLTNGVNEPLVAPPIVNEHYFIL